MCTMLAPTQVLMEMQQQYLLPYEMRLPSCHPELLVSNSSTMVPVEFMVGVFHHVLIPGLFSHFCHGDHPWPCAGQWLLLMATLLGAKFLQTFIFTVQPFGGLWIYDFPWLFVKANCMQESAGMGMRANSFKMGTYKAGNESRDFYRNVKLPLDWNEKKICA